MHDEIEQEESMRASSYGEGVFELIQEIFHVLHVEESDDGRPVTRLRSEMSRKKQNRSELRNPGGPISYIDKMSTNSKDIVQKVQKYGSINVRTLSMKDDNYRKEVCGETAAASEWILEFQARELGVIGLQECRVMGNMVGKEGPYINFHTGEKTEREYGVEIFLLEHITSGEFEVRHVNARLMWVVGNIFGVKQAVVTAYAPTNDEKNRAASEVFYEIMSTEIKSIRDKYGEQIEIVILGDFNARIGNDGGELYASKENSEDMAVNGRFGFPEKNENGYRLTLFCEIMNLKIMDSFFMRPNNDYGTWRSARSTKREYTAALDHILVSEPWWWTKVEQCGVTDDTFHMPTDLRIIELVIQDQGTGKQVNVIQRKKK